MTWRIIYLVHSIVTLIFQFSGMRILSHFSWIFLFFVILPYWPGWLHFSHQGLNLKPFTFCQIWVWTATFQFFTSRSNWRVICFALCIRIDTVGTLQKNAFEVGFCRFWTILRQWLLPWLLPSRSQVKVFHLFNRSRFEKLKYHLTNVLIVRYIQKLLLKLFHLDCRTLVPP